jgi:DNA polymerase-3 subunit beta
VTETAMELDDELDTLSDEGVVLRLSTKKFSLQTLLEKAIAIVPTKDIMPVLKNFYVDAKAGSIRIAATDLELSLVVTTDMVAVQVPGVAVFPAKRLLEIVKEAEEGDLLLEVKDGTAHIQIGRTRWSIKLMDGSDYPSLPTLSKIKFHFIDRSKFLAAISSVRYAAATDTVRPSLMMISILSGRMRAADGVRFQQVVLEDFPLDIQIPINAVDDLVKILKTTETEQIEVGETDSTIIFRVAADVFVAQKLMADFPNVDEILLKPALTNDQELYVDRKELIAAIKRVRITADPETSAVRLILTKDNMRVTSKDKYGSHAEEELDVKWDSGDREVAFNHSHLLDMLYMADVKTCKMLLGADTKTRPSPLRLVDADTGTDGILNQVRLEWISS